MFNRDFFPLSSTVNYFPIYIMWSSTSYDTSCTYWCANHFVPLVKDDDLLNQALIEDEIQPAQQKEAVNCALPQIGDFVKATFTVRKRTIVYMAVVIPPLSDCHLNKNEIFVKYLRQQGGYYVFPKTDDISLLSLLEARVEVIQCKLINNRGHHYFQ